MPRYFPITKAEYFFDTDPGEGMGISLPLIRGDTVDVYRYLRITGLDTGYHYLYIRAMAENNLWGLAQRTSFHVDTAICTLPVADFSFDTVTFGTPCTFTNLSTNIISGTTYIWEINDDTIGYTQNIIHTFTTPGYYRAKLTVVNDSSCSSMIIKEVMTGPLPNTNLLIAGSTILCMGDSVILTSNNYEEGCTFDWSTGDTSRAITIKQTGDYYCWATNSYGISLRSEVVHVQVNAVPAVILTYHNTTGGSANGSAWLVVNGGTGIYTYQWSNGATTSILNGLSAGI
jgi:PKD repeat protein